MKNNMLNKLKSDYEELEIRPSSELWSRLDEKLSKTPEKVKEKPFQWWKYAAVLLIFVSVGAGFYFNTNKSAFNYKETDYMVKKGLEKTVSPINPEFQNQGSYKKPQVIPVKSTDVHVALKDEKKETNSTLNTKKKAKVPETVISEVEIQQFVLSKPEKIEIAPAKIDSHTPVIVQNKTTKPVYINSNELLLGREFDKTRESSQKNDIKFGIFNFEKPKPKVENVTVLGVTVYVDSK